MRVLFSRIASAVLLSISGLAFAAPQIIVPVAPSASQVRFPDALEAGGGTAVRFNVDELQSLPAESEVELSLPNATRHPYILELTQSHGDGTRSFIARHKDLGNRYRAIVTNGPAGSFAVFSTPYGEFRLIPGDGTHDWLVDMANQPAEPPLAHEKDWILPPRIAAEKAVQPNLHLATTFTAIPGINALPRTKATPVPQVTIDIMFVVTNALAANLGANLNTRMNFIVSRANTAYADSEIAITLRLARIVTINYTDANSNNAALDGITPNRAQFDPANFGTIETQRTQAGADIVAFMRNGLDNGGSGLGWVGQPPPFLDPKYMYSVTTGCVRFCESVVIHEIGHNMGNMHDRATVAFQESPGPGSDGILDQGAYPYSYGYAFCNSGLTTCNPTPGGGQCGSSQPECSPNHANNFSDIMAYFHASTERVYKFSNPAVTCVSTAGDQVARACGVSELAANSANTALSMNNMRTAISALKPPGAGEIKFTASSYSGIEGGNIGFVASRSGGTGAVSVQYATANGSATAGLDYVAQNGTLNWADGDSSNKTIVVPILSDNATESTEAFTMTLSGPTGGAILGSTTVATGTIVGTFPSGTLGGLPNSPAGWSTPAASSVPWGIVNDSSPVGDADGLSLKSGALNFGIQNCAGISPFPTAPCPSIIDFSGTFAAGNVGFAYRVSSFPSYGFLEFLVDGVVVLSVSGPDVTPNPDTGWVSYSTPIAAGAHTLRWQFRSGASSPCNTIQYVGDPGPAYPGCLDRAWIDQVSLPINLATSTTALASSANPSTSGQSVTFTATVSGASGTPTGSVIFRNGGVDIPGCVFIALAAGAAQCTTTALPVGANSITAVYSGNQAYNTSTSSGLTQTVNAATQLLAPTPPTVPFGGQSMNTTSPAQSVTLTNGTLNPVIVTAVTPSNGYAVTHNCTTVAASGGTCTLNITFTPPAGPVTAAWNGSISIAYAGGATVVNLTGTAERTLVTHYYRSILRRAPDSGGKAYWEGEAARMQSIGVNINEAWFSMAQFFFFSAEYISFNRDPTGFVTDLYTTFFNRAPDGGGLAFWVGQINAGLPREVVLAGFMFSPEFTAFAQAIFGNTAARAEVDTVMDFYRGLLARLPDQVGFDTWVAQFRTAQCQGAGAVYTQEENISASFSNGTEYTSKNRTNAQYVGDLYNSFLRRGGDLAGVQFWINQLATNTLTRNQVRQNFIASTEFQGRVNAVVNQGCLP